MPDGEPEFDPELVDHSLEFIALCNSSMLRLLSQMLDQVYCEEIDARQRALITCYIKEIKTNYKVNESYIWGLRKSFESSRGGRRAPIDAILDYSEGEAERGVRAGTARSV